MKKYLLFALLLFVVVATAIRAQEYDERYDINKDGKVSIADITTLVSHILAKGSDEQYDTNQDGKVSIADVKTLVSHILGKDVGHGEQAKLTIHFADGTSNDIMLNEQPRVTFEGEDVVITTPTDTYSYGIQTVLGFTYSGISFATSLADGASIGDAFYIYRNDGQFNAFFREEVDSVVYSRYDADSTLYSSMATQAVYTQDSIYKIPLAAIDSVSFVTPQTIVNEKVFELTAAHDPYLSACDTVRFTLSLMTPSEMCPSKGNIVVSTYDCLSFPDGIMARVISMTQDADGIHYNCEQVGLQDVYDQLIFKGNGYVDNDRPQANGRRRVEAEGNWELWNKSWSKTLEKGGTTTTVEVGDAAKMTITVNIQKGKPMYFRLDLQNDITSSFTFNAESSFEEYYEQQLAKVTLPRIRIPQCPLLFIVPKLTLSGYFAEGAKVSLDFGAHYNRTDIVSFILQNKQWSVTHTPVNDAGIDVASLSMTGYAEIGLIPDIFFSFCGTATGLGIEGSVGIKETVNFKFDAVAAFDEGMYAALKDSYARTTLPWSVRAYAQIGLLGDGVQPLSYKLSKETQLGSDKYLLPVFTDLEYRQGANGTTAVLKTQPSRDLLLPVQLGMSFYEEDTKLQTKYLSPTYRNQNEWPLDGLELTYTNMEAGKKYTAYPTVKIMGKALRAVPSKDFPEYDYCPDDNHPHAIDIGLPSGTLWATTNIGADNPEDYGLYFAWGETTGYTQDTSDGHSFDWTSYKYAIDDYNTLTKYCNRSVYGYNGFTDNLTELVPEDDAAYVNWGSAWRMPSKAQQDELRTECTWTWTSKSGKNGYNVVGPNGNSLFLPAAGLRYDTSLYDVGSYGYYWSRTLNTGSPYDGWHLCFSSSNIGTSRSGRYVGRSVRPVRSPQ